MIKKTLKHSLLTCLAALLLSACHTTSHKQSKWPTSLPPEQIFIDAYERQISEGTNDSTLKTHLTWIKRFYRGTILYPVGWNQMTEMVMESLVDADTKQQQETRARLGELGQKISIEWAQSNKTRNINSSNIITWANAMRTSVKQNQVSSFLDKVEVDVDDLISHKLNMDKITRERYYPPENFDDF